MAMVTIDVWAHRDQVERGGDNREERVGGFPRSNATGRLQESNLSW